MIWNSELWKTGEQGASWERTGIARLNRSCSTDWYKSEYFGDRDKAG
ncbi:hypothetical protein [Myxacorys almedinensis]|uniref:Uncharacterized protein n=1 Tax=Myxacorys almedinensis A TaxID=2690445 RepID=A0A8J7Z1F6_9CYAN|nr:hypothetical protein [Myxacorys almedinensis]NDJ18322.1 hypothetical protein [Myxacorys almedinensis A]